MCYVCKSRQKNQDLKPFDKLSIPEKRKRLFKQRGNKCECCGISNWLNKPITIEIDHIDGNHSNNIESNLRLLCPNCHSQTHTYRKRKTQVLPIESSILIQTLQNSYTINDALRTLNLPTNSTNYFRAQRLLKKFNYSLKPISE